MFLLLLNRMVEVELKHNVSAFDWCKSEVLLLSGNGSQQQQHDVTSYTWFDPSWKGSSKSFVRIKKWKGHVWVGRGWAVKKEWRRERASLGLLRGTKWPAPLTVTNVMPSYSTILPPTCILFPTISIKIHFNVNGFTNWNTKSLPEDWGLG